MPVSSEPWPGKQNAIFVTRPSPSSIRISAEPHVRPAPMPVISTSSPGPQAPVGRRVGERERDRARRRVPVAVDVHHHLLLREAQLLDSVLDDADVRLVGNVHVDVVHGQRRTARAAPRPTDEHPRRELEHLAPVHLARSAPGSVELARAAAGQVEARAAGAVGAELEAEEAPLGTASMHDGARRRRRRARASSGRSSRGSSRARRRRRRARARQPGRRASRRPARSRT